MSHLCIMYYILKFLTTVCLCLSCAVLSASLGIVDHAAARLLAGRGWQKKDAPLFWSAHILEPKLEQTLKWRLFGYFIKIGLL